MTNAPDIDLARVYDDLGKTQGARLLVDRVWPRGVSKVTLSVEFWREPYTMIDSTPAEGS